jgi:hypothetical protein
MDSRSGEPNLIRMKTTTAGPSQSGKQVRDRVDTLDRFVDVHARQFRSVTRGKGR